LSRTFYRALDRAGSWATDIEQAKSILMRGILKAASRGEFDEDKLVQSAISAVMAYRETMRIEPREQKLATATARVRSVR
jgi:hypothetical protein